MTNDNGVAVDRPTRGGTARSPQAIERPKLLLTIDEAAHLLSMGRTAIFTQMRRGRLKSVKNGRARRIPIEYVNEFIELLKIESETDGEAA